MNATASRFGLLSACAAALGVSGCMSGTDTMRLAEVVYDQYIGGTPTTVAREEAAAIPFATLGISLSGGRQVMLTLREQRGGNEYWGNPANLSLVTRRGRIMETTGFPRDLAKSQPLTASADAGMTTLDTAQVFLLDLPDMGLYGLTVRCEAEDDGLESIEILEVDLELRHIVEECEAEAIDWDFENEYWVDPTTAFVWRSEQTVHPKQGVITLEALRPYVPQGR